MMIINYMPCSSGKWLMMWCSKLLKLPAEQPQCKSLSNARSASTGPTLRVPPKDFFSLPSLCLTHAVHSGQLTLWAVCVHFGSGSWAQPWQAHAETYKSPQQYRRQICSVTLVFVILMTAAFTRCTRLPSTSRRPSLPEGKHGHHANHTEASLETKSSLTSGRAVRAVARASAWLPA